MLLRRLLPLGALGATLALAACSGSSGGSPARGQLPELVSAVFTGSSAMDNTPDPGDTLTLYFTRAVKIASGGIIDDSVLEPSAGTLGNNLSAPTQLDDTSIRITLGDGVSFTVATDTVKFVEGQKVVTDLNDQEISFAPTATITLSDGVKPTVSFLTINGVPAELNGTGSAGGTQQLPRGGFTLDASYADTAPGTINTSGFVITSTQDVRYRGTVLPAGSNLFTSFQRTSVTATDCKLTASTEAEQDLLFNEGQHTITFRARDTSGLLSDPATYSFVVRNPSTNDRPLENGQKWFLDLTRDLETLTSSASSGTQVIINAPIAGANMVSDFLEDLLIVGLRSVSPIANVSGSKDSNEVTLDLLKAAIDKHLKDFFKDTSVEFTFDDPGAFPSTRPFVAYDATTHSRMAIGGATSDAGTLGVALFDPNNKTQDNNTLDAGTHGGVALSSRLGVFLHTMIEADINRFGSKLRADFDTLIRFRGQPVGEDPTDATRLQNLLSSTSGDTRQTTIDTAIDNLGRFLAVLVAHECGHSLGLVQDGAMPAGLYGGDSTNFPGSTSGHINLTTTMIFPNTATEIMSPAVSYERSVDPATNFNPLIQAYLREQAFYTAR